MNWNLDYLVVAEVEEFSHDSSDVMQFELDSSALFVGGLDVSCTSDELPAPQLRLYESSKRLVDQSFLCLQGDLLSHQLRFFAHL